MGTLYNSQLDAYSLYHKTQESSHTSAIGGPGLPAIGHALAGSTGTAIANLAIYPLDLIITRLQVQQALKNSAPTDRNREDGYDGVADAFEKIYKKEGWKGFYTGVLQDTGKSIADSFLFFLFYTFLREKRLRKHGGQTTTLPALDELAVGAAAGAVSKFFTTPISNIVTRKQTHSLRTSSSSPEPSVSQIADQIYSEKGIQGFWSGYSASLVLTLNPSLTFFLYESFKRSLLPRTQRDDPGASITFLMAAVSKAIASTITYPFSLAKARAQTSSSPPVDPPSAEKVKSEVESAETSSEIKRTGKDATAVAKRSTVFHTILKIYKEEGPAALYEGVFGEILKGFFSHGVTMLLKESIHKLIIQTYYAVLKAMKRYPSPSQFAQDAGSAVQDAGGKAGSAFQNAGTRAGEMAKDSYQGLSEKVGDMMETGKQVVGVGVERAGVVGSNASEFTKNANEYASKEAGHLLGNAQEMLGGKIEEVGKGIKPGEKA